MALRVVAGSLRGRRLVTPVGNETRPTADRIRQATFNSLEAHGLVRGAKVLDLFAGSGAMGVEALSRGAEHVTFVESSRKAVQVIRANIESCGLEDRSEVHQGEVGTFLVRNESSFDLVIADPPYDFDRWADVLGGLDTEAIVIESDRSILDPGDYGEFGSAPYVVLRERNYGTTVVTFAVSRRRDEHGRKLEDRP